MSKNELEKLGLSVRTNNALKRYNINTIEELKTLPDDELLRMRNLGVKGLKEIKVGLENFEKGIYIKPKYMERIGMTNIMNNGKKATIIAYKSCESITIQFEDGAIINRTSFQKFKEGNVTHPNKYIGKTKVMQNGQKATIIAYRGNLDLDIQFEDGTVVNNIYLCKFNRGYLD